MDELGENDSYSYQIFHLTEKVGLKMSKYDQKKPFSEFLINVLINLK
jgi:hypothetical protein